MERAVYFDGWYENEWCQHPSMPPRRLGMIDELAQMGATMLVWSALGGGSISLPYLEEEAYGVIPPRFRQHGFVSESEFIQHARARGIDPFAIIFEAQAWEVPAEIVDGEIVAQTELRNVVAPVRIGLSEFTRDTGPKSWKPFAHYFPDGLRNADGEVVSDLIEEITSRDLDGNPIHARWVEIAERDQDCYFGDRNNPVWREYLKAIIRIQIDAGARAVQLDETATPLETIRYGGCFCRSCVLGFRAYLQTLPADAVPEELADTDLDDFDYAGWLRGQGFRPGIAPQRLPLYQHYSRFQQISIGNTFAELAAFAKEYGRALGLDVRVSGNFYDLAPYYDSMVDHADIIITEMRETRYQQPWYFRHGVGLSRGRQLVAVENPYGGMIPDLRIKLRHGKAWDSFRLTIFEASAMGANMALPYGSWLGNEFKGSYSVPLELSSEVGSFLKEIDGLISADSPHETAVVHSIRSVIRATIDSDQFSDNGRWYEPYVDPETPDVSYWPVVEELSRSSRTFDVVVFPDEGLRANDVTPASLARYRTVVLPDVWGVSPTQHETLQAFVDQGGSVIVVGAYGIELPEAEVAAFLASPSVIVAKSVDQVPELVSDRVTVDLGRLAAVSLHSLSGDEVAVHLINFDFDEDADAVRTLSNVDVAVRVDGEFSSVTLHEPGKPQSELPLRNSKNGWSFTVPALGVYVVAHLH